MVTLTLLFILFIATSMITSQKKHIKILLLLLIFTIITIYSIDAQNKSYKQGQIDALTGKVNFELKTKPDSTRIWAQKKLKYYFN